MSEWRSYHLYHGRVDDLILHCVHPYLSTVEGGLERRFWERHFAGGPHLRVRLRGAPAAVRAAGEGLVRAAERYLAEHPGEPMAGYSEERAAALMRKEGEEPDPETLRYRNDVVEEHPYLPPRHVYASDEALALAEDFRHDSMDLAVAVMGAGRGRNEALLRLFFLQALVVCRGNLPAGCVSCRSHWEGFAASFAAPAVVERIRASEEANREAITAVMREVVERYETGTLEADPLLAGWRDLLEAYRARSHAELARGTRLTDQVETPEEARQAREKLATHLHTESDFVRTFWSDERFIASMRFEPRWIVPRVLTNLLYQFVAATGVGPVDRMALCHYAYRAAEEHYGCDLGEILAGNIRQTVAAHAGRWS